MSTKSLAIQFESSPVTALMQPLREYLLRKWKWYLFFFLFGFIVAFPMTKEIIAWLIDEKRLPEGVNILVTTPIELIVLQVRVSANVGIFFITLFALFELIQHGRHHEVVKKKLENIHLKIPSNFSGFLPAIFLSVFLAALGFLYSWSILVPMLLDYLTQDAQGIGLSTEWKLQSYVGFLVNLVVASMIGFQTPLFTRAMLRYEFVDLQTLKQLRRHIWFGAFVLGAFLSPPDPLSLFLVAMPIIIFFEITINLETVIKGSKKVEA